MTIKKLTFCILCSASAANLATEEDFNDEISSNSKVEENILINKNNWNTRKWGSIYFLFPHLSGFNMCGKIIDKKYSCIGELKNPLAIIFNFIASGVIEYKYMFHKYCGINIRLNINNMESYSKESDSYVSLEPSIEWIYGRKGKHIFSGSFSPLGVAIVQKREGSLVDDFFKRCWTLCLVLLKYEYDRRFYLNFGKVKKMWDLLRYVCAPDCWEHIGYSLVSIEFGLNIIGVNDWRKKRRN